MIETPRAIDGLRDIVAGTNDLSKETGVPLPLARRTLAKLN
jgi:hypothetical protein